MGVNRLYFSRAMKILEILSYVLMIGSIVFIVVFAKSHEIGTVATHFNAAGEPDAYDDPMGMIILPIIFIITNLIMSVIIRFVPVETWNYPMRTINPAAAPYIYKITMWMIIGFMFISGAMSFYMSAITGKGGPWIKFGTFGFLAVLAILTVGGIVGTIKINKKFI